MQTRAANLEIVQKGYRYSHGPRGARGLAGAHVVDEIVDCAVDCPRESLIEADLADQDGLASGSIVNKTGRVLRNARLFYRNWGYRLGDLADGRQIDVGEHLEPRSAKTILTASVLSPTATTSGQAEGGVFFPDRASALELLNLMMFYEAAAELRFAQLPNRFQSDCDLSGMLRPGLGRAILVAEVPDAGSRLIDQSSSEPVGDDFAAVVYRFVIPVSNECRSAVMPVNLMADWSLQ